MLFEDLPAGRTHDVADDEDGDGGRSHDRALAFARLRAWTKYDEDALLLAEPDQPLALRGVAQRVERDVDLLFTRGRIVVEAGLAARLSRTSRSPKASVKIATSSSSSSRANEAASRYVDECHRRVAFAGHRDLVRRLAAQIEEEHARGRRCDRRARRSSPR